MPPHLTANYLAAPESFNELLDTAGEPREHWRAMLASLGDEVPGSMRQRLDMVQRQVRENGVTYNASADPEGKQRPWDLNVLPLILPHEEWQAIEAAVIQRATLLNRILADVYGAQSMLAQGVLPPALIHGHAGFLRPCHGLPHRDGVALHFCAVDLARAPDGRWWVVADRTQAPSGAGYALENRAIIAPTFPDLLRELKVRPLAGFFRTMLDSLVHWGRLCAASGDAGAPLRGNEQPLIVLLTPGTRNETYSEQAYLARYLGLPLVEGGDLTVRNGMVWLKTLSGLQRVHVLLRRVDDDQCDPLELAASALGVAGLTQVARRGNVLIANSLGAGLLESGALLGFLPALCEQLLGEALKMPSVATWWCGEPAALEEVIDRLDELVVKPSSAQMREDAVFGQDLRGTQRADFIAKLRANPNGYVAQEMVRLSQAPVWNDGVPGGPPGTPQAGLQARAVGLRVFACATPNGYVVMPGGLTRVATGPDARVLTMQKGGASKDTWVQASAHAPPHSIARRSTTSEDLVRDDANLSSRVAENLLWFGRNVERCDNIARLLRVALNFLFDVRFAQRGAEWPTVEALCIGFHLIDTTGANTRQYARAPQPPPAPAAEGEIGARAPAARFADAQIEAALLMAVVSPDVPGLAKQKDILYRTAGTLHERFSADNWRALIRMVQRVPDTSARPTGSEAMAILDDAATALMTMAGFALDGMTRDIGWRFLSIGRRLERLQFQCTVLQHALAMDADGNLEWLLELSDSIVTYRARYRARPEWLPVLDLLLLDGSNPRAIVFQLDGILGALQKIAVSYGPCGADLLAPLAAELLALAPDADFFCGNERLIDLLRRIKLASAALSEQIGLQFFSHSDNAKGQGA
jgi:uncharacterized circularly permuted ATP-grasp superfamily protein/uncharacterized alpha-E superfamily protein